MALGTISDPNALSQGGETVVSDWVVGTPTGQNVTHTSAANNFPVLIAGEFFELRDHTNAVNNGLYVATGVPDDASLPSTKINGAPPIAASTESASAFASIITAVADMVFANQALRAVDITSATSALPTLAVGSRFVVSDYSDADNNGTYEVTLVNTVNDDYSCLKLDTSTAEPNNGATEPATTTHDVKSVMYDTQGRGIYLLEAPSAIAALDLDGMLGQAFYSFTMISWKDDAFLIANAPFPMLTIDADAGKYFIGQDPSGNNSGWITVDDSGNSIRTTKLVRNMGWSEIDSLGVLLKQFAGIRTLGAFLDETALTGDTAYYHFGTDTTVDDSVSFDFAGPVNEAIQTYDSAATALDAGTGFAITTTDTITRNDGGNWRTDGYIVGGQIVIFDAEDGGNDGTHIILSVADGVDGALVVTSASTLVNNAADNTAHFGWDNRNALTLKLRERTTAGNSNARTFAQSDLAAAGETVLSNRLFTFGLSNSQDLDIAESDANIDGNAPYTGMTLTYYAAPQSLGGAGDLVGGPYNFGIVIVANNGTNTQVYEWTERQLRKTTDIDADADTAIGVMMDGLMRFLGPTLQVGSTDGGLSFPANPDGGGSGVFITGLNSASRNDTVYYDNLGVSRAHPLGVPVTLDFNSTIIDDAVATYTLFFDATIYNAVADLVVTAGTLADGTFVSAGTNMPTSIDAGIGGYIRVTGMAGADEPMNGIYQVTSITSGALWGVTRVDGATIVTTASTAASIDEHPLNSPDAIIVKDDTPVDVTGTDPAVDFVFTFDYSGNIQGGRTASADAFVRARAVGQSGAQYTQTTTQTIGTAATTIPVSSNIERNFLNP